LVTGKGGADLGYRDAVHGPAIGTHEHEHVAFDWEDPQNAVRTSDGLHSHVHTHYGDDDHHRHDHMPGSFAPSRSWQPSWMVRMFDDDGLLRDGTSPRERAAYLQSSTFVDESLELPEPPRDADTNGRIGHWDEVVEKLEPRERAAWELAAEAEQIARELPTSEAVRQAGDLRLAHRRLRDMLEAAKSRQMHALHDWEGMYSASRAMFDGGRQGGMAAKEYERRNDPRGERAKLYPSIADMERRR
jgi:hypothetical protein